VEHILLGGGKMKLLLVGKEEDDRRKGRPPVWFGIRRGYNLAPVSAKFKAVKMWWRKRYKQKKYRSEREFRGNRTCCNEDRIFSIKQGGKHEGESRLKNQVKGRTTAGLGKKGGGDGLNSLLRTDHCRGKSIGDSTGWKEQGRVHQGREEMRSHP